jgi:hypothetical protein
MAAYDLRHYDGVSRSERCPRAVPLARLAQARLDLARGGRHARVQAAAASPKQGDLVWVGNWGDEERTAELHEFLLGP